MRHLIDGYNVMYAQGLLGKQLGPTGFRKARTRFLNDLSKALGAVDAHLTTVVFDAAAPPEDLPRQATHKGLTIIYAVDDENADARIERLIAEHPAPKTLTVVSTDHRIRRAATRRKAKALSADEFLYGLQDRKSKDSPSAPPPSTAEPSIRERSLSAQESQYWLNEFRELAEHPDSSPAFKRDGAIPTDAEIAEIERQVDEEFKAGGRRD